MSGSVQLMQPLSPKTRPPAPGGLAFFARQRRWLPHAAALALAISLPGGLAWSQSGSPLRQIDRDELCVTNGAVTMLPGGRLGIATPSSRAVVATAAGSAADQVAELRFRYLGPSQTSKPLASGELRRQIGLKLRAQDTCNLIYAMWHIEPDAGIAVSIKHNAGMNTHAQCGAGGYVNFKAPDRLELPPVRPGETHALRAALHGHELTVTADGKLAWQGALANELLPLDGPPGFRTDNARFELEYSTDSVARSLPPALRPPSGPGRCEMSEGD
jgi:hypothetical protein